MPDSSPLSSRKGDHIRINLDQDVQSRLTTGLEEYRFIPRALPEIDLGDVDLSLQILGKTLRSPILISSMTGGTQEAGIVNHNLAKPLNNVGLPWGLDHKEQVWKCQNLIRPSRCERRRRTFFFLPTWELFS